MKAKTLQIVWHSKEPVFSVDFHPDGYIATGGADKEIKIWELNCAADGTPGVQYRASLEGHSAAVNCVRFSKTGHSLASAGDSGEVIVWRPVRATPAAIPGQDTAAYAAGTPDGSGSPGGNTPPPTPACTTAAAQSPVAAAKAGTAAGVSAARGPAAAKDAAAEVQEEGSLCGVKWKVSHTLRGHRDDVMDVAWAHDDAVLLTGSVENEVQMFDVNNRQNLQRLECHRHYVQGVAWDPLGVFLVSASADRSVRVLGLKPPGTGGRASAAAKTSAQLAREYIHTATLLKRTRPAPSTLPREAAGVTSTGICTEAAASGSGATDDAAAAADQQQQHPQQQHPQQPSKPLQAFLFQDESLGVFFRRLSWSPDGSLLAIPAGISKGPGSEGSGAQHTTYVYARGNWSSPVAALPCPLKASTAVKFCPVLFKLRQPASSSPSSTGRGAAAAAAAGGADAATNSAAVVNALGLPYRLVLAVATVDSVLLYDMQTLEPFLLVGPLHYDQITDLAWARDGSCLAVSSRDGYCSLVTFQPGELGDLIHKHGLPPGLVTTLHKVATAAATTAAKCGGTAGAAGGAVAASSAPVRSAVAVAHAAAGSPVAPSGDSSQRQQQLQQQAPQRPAVKRIQPQAVSPVPAAAAPSSSRPASSPAFAAAAAAAAPVVAAVGQPRRLTPTPVASPAAAPAAPPASISVVDLTQDELPAAAQGKTSSGSTAAKAAGSSAAPAPAPRRLTPQPVVPGNPQQRQEQQQQQRNSPAPVASPVAGGAVGGAAQSRTAVAAVIAAMAAAKKKQAAKRAAEGGDGAAGEGDAKRPKNGEACS